VLGLLLGVSSLMTNERSVAFSSLELRVPMLSLVRNISELEGEFIIYLR
jgi:hypothetical protein